MVSGRDDFDKSVIEALAKRSSYICSNPHCRNHTLAPSKEDPNKAIYIGKAAHITAASEGGPRFNPDISSDERKSIENGIFLCSNCADMIDKNNGADFPAEVLEKWKTDHEFWVSENLNKKVYEKVTPTQVFNVTSVNQRGGITAGVVTFKPQPRTLGDRQRNQLRQLLPDSTKTVTIISTMGDGEALQYAQEIKKFLENEGFNVKGVDQSVSGTPMIGQAFDPDTLTLRIGTRE